MSNVSLWKGVGYSHVPNFVQIELKIVRNKILRNKKRKDLYNHSQQKTFYFQSDNTSLKQAQSRLFST